MKYITKSKDARLTSYQKDVWNIMKKNEGNVGNISLSCSIRGPLDFEMLNSSVKSVIRENDTLRIHISEKKKKTRLAFISEPSFSLPYFDFSKKNNPLLFADEWMMNETTVPFECLKLPFKFVLIMIKEQHHLFFIKMHPIIGDPSAIVLVLNRIIYNYNFPEIEISSDRCSNFSSNNIIKREIQYIASKRYASDVRFWGSQKNKEYRFLFNHSQKLSGRNSVIKKKIFRMNDDTRQRMIHFSEVNQLPVSHIFVAIFTVVFLSYFEKKSMVMGIPFINRDKPEENIIGRYINFLPFPIDINRFCTFNEMLKSIHGDLSKRYRHSQLSLGKIWEVFEKKEINHHNVFDAIVSHITLKSIDSFSRTETQIDSFSPDSLFYCPIFIAIVTYEKKNALDIHFHCMDQAFDTPFSIDELHSLLDIKIDQFLRNPDKKIWENDFVQTLKDKKDCYPLSFRQKQIWSFCQINKDKDDLINSLRVWVNEKVDFSLLELAVQKTIERHNLLRTDFITKEGLPCQIIRNRKEFKLKHFSLQNNGFYLPDDMSSQKWNEGINPKPDITKDLLLDVIIDHISEDNFMIGIMMHPLISDKLSLFVFLKDMTLHYQSLITGKNSFDLPVLDFQFPDYSNWQLQELHEECTEEKRSILKNRISACIDIGFPFDFPSILDREKRLDTYTFPCSQALSEKMNQFSTKHEIALPLVFISIISILLYKYTGKKSLCIGWMNKNRDNEKFLHLIGPFENVFPLFFDLNDDDTYHAVLNHTKERFFEFAGFHGIPFENLAGHIDSALFSFPVKVIVNIEYDNIFNYNSGFKWLDAKVSQKYLEDNLLFNFKFSGSNITPSIEYPNHFFQKVTIEKIASHFLMVLKIFLSKTMTKISDIQLLTIKEKHEMLLQCNQPPSNSKSQNKCLHEYFEDMVNFIPKHIAVIDHQHHITYEELNRKANSLAHVLLKNKDQWGNVIGVFLPPSEKLVVSVLAILKSGGAFLPLDTQMSKDQLLDIVSRSGTTLIITDSKNTSCLPVSEKKKMIWDKLKDMESDANRYDENISVAGIELNPDDLSYVRYPLGAMFSHQNIVSYILWAKKEYANEKKINLPLYTSLSYCHGLFSIMIPLLTGGTVVIYLTPEIDEIIDDSRVEMIMTDPMHLKFITQDQFIAPQLKKIVIFSNGLSERALHKISGRFPTSVAFFSEYEHPLVAGGIFCHRHRLEGNLREEVILGHPSDNIRTYITDPLQRLVPNGVIGEITVSGCTVSLGLYKQPDETVQLFSINTFCNTAPSVMLKTGVMGRNLPDGTFMLISKKKSGTTSISKAFLFQKNANDEVHIEKIKIDEPKDGGPKNTEKSVHIESMDTLKEKRNDKEDAPCSLYDKNFINEEKISSPESVLEEIGSKVIHEKKHNIESKFNLLGHHGDIHSTQQLNNTYILSFTQKYFWNLNKLEKYSSFYHIPKILKINGNLNYHSLENSIFYVFNRHSILTTQFIVIHGEVRQKISNKCPFKLYIRDFSHFTKINAQRKTLDIIGREAKKVFNLAYDALIRMILFKIAEDEYILFLNIHCIIADEVSVNLFLSEISYFYIAHEKKTPLDLPPLEIQYKDHAIFQQSGFNELSDVKNKKYWQDRLSDLPFLNLPTNDSRTFKDSLKGRIFYFSWDHFSDQKLIDFTNKHDVSLHTVLISSFLILLHKYSGQTDICIGTSGNDRGMNGTRRMIGPFSMPVALRINLDRNASFLNLLMNVKDAYGKALEHKNYPVEKIIEMANPNQKMGHAPLFQTMLLLDSLCEYGSNIFGLESSEIPMNEKNTAYELVIRFKRHEKGLSGCIEYQEDLYNEAFIRRLVTHMKTLTELAVKIPEKKFSEFDMLSDKERELMIDKWNHTNTPYLKALCVHRLFEESSTQAGTEIAIEHNNDRITYEILNKDANRLAHYLHKRGVSPKMAIGICLERSIDLIKGILSIIKAGGAYIYIDPFFSQEKISRIVEECKISIILTRRSMRRLLPKNRSQLICLEDKAHLIEKEPDSNPKNQIMLDDPVYVTYVMGSDGNFSGIKKSHRLLHNLLHWQRNQFLESKTKRVLQFSSLSEDTSFQEIFSSLSSGLTLILLNEDHLNKIDKLSELIHVKNINRIFLPTKLLHYLSSQMIDSGITPVSLNEIIVNGERLKITPVVSDFFRSVPHCHLINHYGLRASHVVTSYTLSGEIQNWPYTPPIGRPISNTKVYVVDQYMNPQPVGIPGELLIEITHFSDLAVDKIIKNPFSSMDRSMLLRTGDRVRYLPDGNIYFIGRNEEFVKIKNMHIELSEIETVLNEIYGIRESVVAARKDKTGNIRLIAYMIFDDLDLTKETIISEMAKILPSYMIPSVFMRMAKFPIGSENKVDKKALPNPRGF